MKFKIIQIIEYDRGHGSMMVIGLGNDNKLYYWMTSKCKWEIYDYD